MPGPSSSPEHPRHPSPSPVPVPSRSRAASVSEVNGRHSQEDTAGRVAWKEKGKQRATDVLENEMVSSPTRSTLSGSGRGTSDAEPDPESVDTSGEIRVRGKEQELSAVRAERRAREKWWETEAETTMIREEKTGYEDKIKKLEEEVLRLREEVQHLFLLYFFLLLTFPYSKVGEEASDELCRSLVFHASSTSTSATAPTSIPYPSADTYNSCGRGAFFL